MKFKLGASEPVRETITLPGGTFEVLVKRPSFADLVKDAPLAKDYLEDRFRTSIVGWEGVEEETEGGESKPIPFTWENLQKLCSSDPAIFWQLMGIVRRNYQEARATRKNSPDAFAGFSADAILKAGGLSGKPIANSEDLPGSPVPLESVSNA